ncbi:MAG: class IV adenylate cyclase [Planctomycetes bacterium]|nr:class IV adenylate cyclase [Planctomycetota bacterium]
MRRNIELKARCEDPARAAAVCERLGARREWVRRQVDTYFAVPDGRLKLRVEAPGEAMLVRYHRDNRAAARESLYEVTPVSDPAAMLAALTREHGVRCQVTKVRTLYLIENVRIHLDEVEELGSFVEFEAVMGEGGSDAAARELLRRLQWELGIAEGDLLAGSYSDLLASCSYACSAGFSPYREDTA